MSKAFRTQDTQWIAQEGIWTTATVFPALSGNSSKLLRSGVICKALQEIWPKDTACWGLMFLSTDCVCSVLKILCTCWHQPLVPLWQPQPGIRLSTQPHRGATSWPHPSNRPLSADVPGFVIFRIKCRGGGKINGISINIISLVLVKTLGVTGNLWFQTTPCGMILFIWNV